MKNPNLSLVFAAVVLIFAQTTVIASPAITTPYTVEQLILAVDAAELASYALRSDTYASQYNSKEKADTSTDSKLDMVSKKLKNVSKAFKRITSIRSSKRQKFRAKLGKSSLTFKYTRTL